MSGHAAKIAAALAVLSGLAAAVVRAEDDAERVFKRVSPSLVTLLTFDEQGRQEGQGSGVVVEAGRIATNCHVVRDARSLKVLAGEKEYAATWTSTDPSRDLCVVNVDGLTAPTLTTRILGELKAGEPVFAVGNPLGFRLSVSSGLISMIAPLQGERVILFSAPLSPGSSGGGLFDADGRLLGITSAILGSGQSLNLALPADWIGELGTRGIAPPPPVSAPGPEPRWVEEAQALHHSGEWTLLEKHARDWHAGQPTSSSAADFLALALDGQKRPAETEAALRIALKLDDKNALAWYHLAALLHNRGQKAEADKAWMRAKEIFPAQGALHRLRAEWLHGERRLQEAKSEVREAIRLEPGVDAQWRELGQLEDQLGQPEEAAKAYRVALQLNPTDDPLKQALAQVLARQGKPEEAHRALGPDGNNKSSDGQTWVALGTGEFSRKRYAAAESAYRKATELSPDHPGAWAGLGAVLAETGRPAEAETALDRALALPSLPPEVAADHLVNRASVRMKLGNKAGALADVNKAMALAPNNGHAAQMLGILKIESREYKEAIAAYRKVVALGTAGVDDWVSLGESLGLIGEAKDGLEALERAEKLDPNNKRVLQALTGFHGRRGDSQRALNYIERALLLDSSDARNWSNKGYALLKLNRVQEAATALETATSLDPEFANAWINLGEAHLRGKNLGKAIQTLEKALTLAPAAVDARLFLAHAYLGSRQAPKAREQAEMLLRQQPDLAQALAVATLAYLIEGKADAASGSYQRLRTKDSTMAHALRASALSQGLPGAQSLPE